MARFRKNGKAILGGFPVKVLGYNSEGFPIVKKGKSILRVYEVDLEK